MNTRITPKLLEKTEKLHDLNLYRGKYRVKPAKDWNYVLFNYDDKAFKKDRSLVVEDAIDGRMTLIPFKEIKSGRVLLTSIKDEMGNLFDNEYDKFMDKEFKKAERKSKRVKGLVGKMISLGVADGCAYYVVTHATAKKVQIEWRGFCPDRWTDRVLGYGGSFDKSLIERLVF